MTDAISPIQPSAGQGMPNFRTSFYDAGHVAMMRTRQFVTPSWRTVSAQLRHAGDITLAGEVDDFVRWMLLVQTDRSMLAEHLRSDIHIRGLE